MFRLNRPLLDARLVCGLSCLLVLASNSTALSQVDAEKDENDWSHSVRFPEKEKPISLFNGKDFTGWEGHIGKYFSIEDGVIVAKNEKANAPPVSFLQQMLRDLIHSESMEESQRFAALVQEYLGAVLSSPNRGVKQAPLWVLAGVEMPAALVELGFMTNPAEARRLGDPKTQARIAEALADAVAAFRFELDLRRGVAERSAVSEQSAGE